MDRAGAKIAFQLEPHQSVMHAVGDNDVLASRKADIRAEDGSTRRVTLFFRTQADELANLQSQGLADSSKVTVGRLRKLLVSRGANLIQVEQLFHHIRAHNYSSSKQEQRIKQQTSGQPAPLVRQQSLAQIASHKMEVGWAKTFATPDIAMSLVDSLFAKAIKDGHMMRVDSQLHESKPIDRSPKTPSPDITTAPAANITTTPATPSVMSPPSPVPADTLNPDAPPSISMIDNS